MNDWCRHYRAAAYHETCESGIAYSAVEDRSERPSRWPCTSPEIAERCAAYEPRSAEEIAEMHRLAAEFMSRMADFMTRQVTRCPRCDQLVTEVEQIGRSVYARPCGCRLWQGAVPKEWRES